jgi:hypothetical protein
LLAYLAQGPEEKQHLFTQACEKCEQAEKLQPGISSYNLACIAALCGDKDGCHVWLEKCLVAGKMVSCEHLKSDEDLSSVRDEDWFKEIERKVCEAEAQSSTPSFAN